MSDSRSEVVSLRFSPDELARLQKLADGRTLSTVIRDLVVDRVSPPTEYGNPHAVRQRGEGWIVNAAPGRTIEVHRYEAWPLIRSPRDARALAVALLKAADIAEQPEPDEEVA